MSAIINYANEGKCTSKININHDYTINCIMLRVTNLINDDPMHLLEVLEN